MDDHSEPALKFFATCLANQHATLPILEHLSMAGGPSDLRLPWVNSFLERLEASPQLHSLHIADWYEIVASDLLPWRSIRQFRLRYYYDRNTDGVDLNLNGILKRAKECPHLTMLDIGTLCIYYLGDKINPPVPLSHLRTLKLFLPHHEDFVTILQSIKAVHLESLILCVQMMCAYENRPPPIVAQCLDHYALTLRALKIPAFISTHPDEVGSAFQNLRNLESLTLLDFFVQQYSTNALDSLILVFDDSGQLVRGKNLALKHFEIDFVGFWPQKQVNDAFVASLLQVITSRWYIPVGARSNDGQPIQRLCSFHVKRDSPLPLDGLLQEYPVEYERIKQCWREGLTREFVSE
ncbi:uncharacterized protein STEHIDRAFT_156144 [Stereum hirsutum FP-91666 SS1]|uniref:uncharacterized protein n=1 Tax=Stereum hirsutum (strain FP-91666) TaxID=721885 RepID=UPI000440C266|nr:uncharacterized protein STEHIDRAFT_156144 [Stereum hirsutum FP-91666 SS1]EIM87157.1 hypothetical protein STEHIDRAFT_156144 [Stereum hirsutum FP-91666 SS1]